MTTKNGSCTATVSKGIPWEDMEKSQSLALPIRRVRWQRLICLLLPCFALASLLVSKQSVIPSSHIKDLVMPQRVYHTPSMTPHLSNEQEVLQEPPRNILPRPFTGAFARFPSLAEMDPQQKRITLIANWMHDSVPPYMSQFFHSAQLNADSVDLLFINRRLNSSMRFLDFEAAGIDITWGGNIKVVQMEHDDWLNRHVNVLCRERHGWNCNSSQREEVLAKLSERHDYRNMAWRPLLGEIHRDLIDSDAQFWGWIDVDTFLGRFTHFPFGILANSSLVSSHLNSIHLAFMAGQLTAFNFNDEYLPSAWLTMPTLRTPEHYTRGIAGNHSRTIAEETDWSFHYIGVNSTQAGYNLTYALLHDMQGDDSFDDEWAMKDANFDKHSAYLISGRDVIQISTDLEREDYETLLQLERSVAPGKYVDDKGSTGWSGGIDGSSELIKDPTLSSRDAMRMAYSTNPDAYKLGYFEGLLEDVQWQTGDKPCWQGSWILASLRLCLAEHRLSKSRPSLLRASFVHFRGQKPGHLFRRLERDARPRDYSRKIIKHNLHSKIYTWMKYPAYPITEDLAMMLNGNSVTVWKIGAARDQTIYHRQRDGKLSIG